MEKQQTLEVKKEVAVDLLWFSVLADHRGRRSEQMVLPVGSTAGELMDRLAEEMPVISDFRSYIRIAVNQSYADEQTVLKNGDEIALITPVSGG